MALLAHDLWLPWSLLDGPCGNDRSFGGTTCMLGKHSHEKSPFASMICSQAGFLESMSHIQPLLELAGSGLGQFPHSFNWQLLMCKTLLASPSLFI